MPSLVPSLLHFHFYLPFSLPFLKLVSILLFGLYKSDNIFTLNIIKQLNLNIFCKVSDTQYSAQFISSFLHST